MNLRILSVLLASQGALGPSVAAHEPAMASAGKRVTIEDITPAAAGAVKVVDAFSAAIKAAKLDDAAKLLDPQVLILESGSSERTRAEYLREHAGADAAFMQTAQQQLRYRQARVAGDVAWVGSESLLQATKNGNPLLLLSTETMVLRRTAQGWRIVHVHWSSRPAPKEEATPSPGA